MIILGVDPGTISMGYGVVDAVADRISSVAFGALTGKSRSPIGERLHHMYTGLADIIARFKPEALAVESPFVARNARSAIMVATDCE